MTLMIERIGPVPDFVARVTGVDLRKPLDDETFATIQDAFHRYAVLVLPDQDIDDDQQIAFSERFGPLERALSYDQYGGVRRPEISRLSNVEEDGTIMKRDCDKAVYHRGNLLWHSDSSFKPVPANASILSGREVPPVGADTEFADARAAYDAWPGSRRGHTKADLDGLVAEHSIVYSRGLIVGDIFDDEAKARMKTVRQTFVRRHPVTGRKVFYVGSHCSRILGWRDAEARALINELTHWNTQRRFVYAHKWQPHDLVMWDNRSVFHRGTPWGDEVHRRIMHRTTVAGDGPTAEQDAAA